MLLKMILFICISLYLLSTIILSEEKVPVETLKQWIIQLGDESDQISDNAMNKISNLHLSYRKLLLDELKTNENIKIKNKLKIILKNSEDKLNDVCNEFYLKSNQYYLENKYTFAIQGIGFILDLDPENKKALELKAKVLKSNDEFKECIIVLKKLLTIYQIGSKEAEKINFELVRVYMIAEEHAEAIKVLEDLLLSTNLTAAVKRVLCFAYELNNQIDKAEEMHLKSEKEYSAFNLPNHDITFFYVRTAQPNKAKPFLEKCLMRCKSLSMNEVLSYLFSEQYQNGNDKIKTVVAPFLKDWSDKKTLTIKEIDPDYIFYFCYQLYFGDIAKIKSNIDFKALYFAFPVEDRKIWPINLLGLYGGVITAEQLEDQLLIPNKCSMRAINCEAYFYIGLLKLIEGDIKKAKIYFQLSKNQNIYEYAEYTSSCYFLQKLN